jgi:triacylglycerol lipase
MSFLVQISESAYPGDGLDGFTATGQFNLDNARAMMWLSQLAYETSEKPKIENVLKKWKLQLRGFRTDDPVTGLPPHSACLVAAGGRGATMIALAGTDPLKIEDWITDFTAARSATGLHEGFDAAVDKVWPDIEAAIVNRPANEQALFFTGHSLGGALAILAADRARTRLNAAATAVYTFGGPRVGGVDFFNGYTPQLGERTFRVVHGGDLVATVPPSLPVDFRHVGRLVQCAGDGVFDAATPIAPGGENNPEFLQSALQDGLADLRALAAFRPFRRIGPRPLDRLAALLPRMVRDHVPANYFRALSIPLR